MNTEFLKNRMLALSGIIGPLFSVGGIFLAISQSSWFGWRVNALSDLGVSDAALFFNMGLIIGGILLVIFIIHIIIKTDWDRLPKSGFFILLLAMIFLILIGIFTEDYDPLHWLVSATFFLLLLIAMLILGISFSRSAEYRFFGIFALIASIIGLASWFVDWGGGVAIPEAFSAFPICIWSALLAVKFYRTDQKF